MALEKTEAVILKSSNWSETSRIVEMFSRDFGKMSLVDKGGRRFKSKRGRLVPFARLEITFYKSEKSATGYVSEAELIELFGFEKEGTMGRLAYASAACELLHHLLSDEQPQPSLYSFFITFLKLTDTAEKGSLPPLFLAFFLHLLSQLGYHPSLAKCVGCGKPMETPEAKAGEVLFCPERGGVICATCKTAGDYYIPLSRESSVHLVALQKAPLSEAARVPIGYREVSCLLEALIKFASYQTGVVSRLKSLEFLEKLKDSYQANGKASRQT
jgi:DNA repair protein RecO (recombination protein O)